jgi:murein DD-endopeptidase MepM/ murein hydrolase activator NlpD
MTRIYLLNCGLRLGAVFGVFGLFAFSGLLGCGHSYESRSGGLRTPRFELGLSGSSDEGESLRYEDYVPSPRGERIGYRPRHSFALGWPLEQLKINQRFKPKKRRRPHLGVDLAGVKKTPVFAAHEGLVVYAGRAFRGFGRLVVIEYDDQWATIYAHLDKILVKQGEVVPRGAEVGLMGRSGRATGVHLHFEVLHNQRPVDPEPLLNEAPRVVESRN